MNYYFNEKKDDVNVKLETFSGIHYADMERALQTSDVSYTIMV